MKCLLQKLIYLTWDTSCLPARSNGSERMLIVSLSFELNLVATQCGLALTAMLASQSLAWSHFHSHFLRLHSLPPKWNESSRRRRKKQKTGSSFSDFGAEVHSPCYATFFPWSVLDPLFMRAHTVEYAIGNSAHVGIHDKSRRNDCIPFLSTICAYILFNFEKRINALTTQDNWNRFFFSVVVKIDLFGFGRSARMALCNARISNDFGSLTLTLVHNSCIIVQSTCFSHSPTLNSFASILR